jgi:hypothetical protein
MSIVETTTGRLRGFTTTCVLILALGLSPTAHSQDLGEAIAEAAGIPNIPAFLPDRYTVAKSRALPIDGVYMVSSIRKKIRIEKGRAFALDPWLHMFVLQVSPDMVVMQNFRRVRPGQYTADDLPLLGQATMRLTANGDLDVNVASKFGPVKYNLIRLEEQYPDVFQKELKAANLSTGSSSFDDMGFGDEQSSFDDMNFGNEPNNRSVEDDQSYREAPRIEDASRDLPEDCVPINIDPDTGDVTCA